MGKCYEHEERPVVKCRNCKHLGWWKEESSGEMFFGWCSKVLDSPDPDVERECRGFEWATNADRIRTMSDEEMAAWYCGMYQRICLDFAKRVELSAEIRFEDNKEQVLAYLQQPLAEEA